MKKFYLILIIFISFLLGQLFLISKAVAYTDSIARLEKEIGSLKEENQRLELLIASQSAYSTIVAKTREGISQMELQTDHSVALRR